MKKTLAIAVAAILSGCASDPANIAASSVSPMQYNEYECKQVIAEIDRVTTRKTELELALKKKSDNDTAQMTVGMILFWPALFFLEGGDGPEAAEYARLKGEDEALRKTAITKQCELPTPAPVAPIPEPVQSEPDPI